MSTLSVADVLQGNSYRINSDRKISNIEQAEALPEWLAPWAQNQMWAKRLKRFLDAGYEAELRQSITYIKARADIGCQLWYFNSMWSNKNLSKTLHDMRQLFKTEQLVEQVTKIIETEDKNRGAIYAACKRWGNAVIRHAITAREIGRKKFKFFCWLTSQKQRELFFMQALPGAAA